MEAAASQQVRSIDTTGIKELLYENFEHPRWDNVASRCLTLCQLHDGLPHLLLHFGGRCDRRYRGSRRTLAPLGFLLHAKLFLYPRRQRPNLRQSTLSPVDDPQAGLVDRPVRQFGMCWLRSLHYLVPGGHRHHRRGPGYSGRRQEWKRLERIIAEHPFFAGLDDGFTNLMVSCASNVRFKAGTYILKEGDPANTFYLIREGKVAVEVLAPQHKPIIVSTLSVGEILGWSWLLPPFQWKFHARAVDDVRAIALDGKCLRTKCEENHDLGYEVLKRFAQIMEQRLEATRLQLLDVYAVK